MSNDNTLKMLDNILRFFKSFKIDGVNRAILRSGLDSIKKSEVSRLKKKLGL